MSGTNKVIANKSEIKSTMLQCMSLHEYLKSLPNAILDKLYNNPMACLAICRELSDIAKNFVMRLLFVEQPVPQAVISSWVSKAHAVEYNEAIEALTVLKMFNETSMAGGLQAWTLNPNFKKNYKMAVLGGGKSWFMYASLEPDPKPRDITFLKSYALERWDCILQYMVGSRNYEGISADAVRILLSAGLLSDEGGSAIITKDGFQFLLMDTPSQVWYFLLQYFNTLEGRGMDLALCLMFLFQLKFCVLGKDYSTDGMNDGMLAFLQHLREFGLVYQRKRKAGRFYPTHLVLTMGTPQSSLLEKPIDEGFIIIETNYRIYAYTTSELKLAIVALFCAYQYKLPKVAVGLLTRDSVRVALKAGITAHQIVHFLRTHAHPAIYAKRLPAVPPAIVDQIFLWEQESNRIKFTEGVLYSQFLSQTDFDVVREYAQDLGVLVWQNEKRRTLVVNKSGYDDVKKYWKRHSKGGN